MASQATSWVRPGAICWSRDSTFPWWPSQAKYFLLIVEKCLCQLLARMLLKPRQNVGWIIITAGHLYFPRGAEDEQKGYRVQLWHRRLQAQLSMLRVAPPFLV